MMLSCTAAAVEPIAHRGLLVHAPENTLANFTACLNLRLGFEFDVRRTKDGVLVCLHDDTVDRTTDGHGKVSDFSLADLSRLDAGSWFLPQFAGQRIPGIEGVLALIAAHPEAKVWCTVDMKADDERVEQDMIELARKHHVLNRLLFIGRTIDHPEVRRRLRQAAIDCHTAALATTRDDLVAAIEDHDSDWVYLRFVPEATDIAAIRKAGKKSIIAGANVAGEKRDAWHKSAAAGVDLILTDYPLELRQRLLLPGLQQAVRP